MFLSVCVTVFALSQKIFEGWLKFVVSLCQSAGTDDEPGVLLYDLYLLWRGECNQGCDAVGFVGHPGPLMIQMQLRLYAPLIHLSKNKYQLSF